MRPFVVRLEVSRLSSLGERSEGAGGVADSVAKHGRGQTSREKAGDAVTRQDREDELPRLSRRRGRAGRGRGNRFPSLFFHAYLNGVDRSRELTSTSSTTTTRHRNRSRPRSTPPALRPRPVKTTKPVSSIPGTPGTPKQGGSLNRSVSHRSHSPRNRRLILFPTSPEPPFPLLLPPLPLDLDRGRASRTSTGDGGTWTNDRAPSTTPRRRSPKPTFPMTLVRASRRSRGDGRRRISRHS